MAFFHFFSPEEILHAIFFSIALITSLIIHSILLLLIRKKELCTLSLSVDLKSIKLRHRFEQLFILHGLYRMTFIRRLWTFTLILVCCSLLFKTSSFLSIFSQNSMTNVVENKLIKVIWKLKKNRSEQGSQITRTRTNSSQWKSITRGELMQSWAFGCFLCFKILF